MRGELGRFIVAVDRARLAKVVLSTGDRVVTAAIARPTELGKAAAGRWRERSIEAGPHVVPAAVKRVRRRGRLTPGVG